MTLPEITTTKAERISALREARTLLEAAYPDQESKAGSVERGVKHAIADLQAVEERIDRKAAEQRLADNRDAVTLEVIDRVYPAGAAQTYAESGPILQSAVDLIIEARDGAES